MKTERSTALDLKPEGRPVKATGRRTVLGSPLIVVLLAAGIGTAALGSLALLGWVLGWPLLASFGANLIPMAPSTAVLFLLYGVAVSLRARTPLSGPAFPFSVMAGFLGMLIALPLFVLGCLDVQWSGEYIGLNITGTFQGVRLGHMSPVTAFVFLFAGLSFLASLSRSEIRRWRAALALGSAVVLLGTCFIFLLAYLYGAPLLYGGAFIPPALNTILAFTMLGLALLILTDRAAGWLGGPRGSDSRIAFALLLIFLFLAMGIIAAGYINYRHYEKQFRTEAERRLSTIADLKVGELVQWRRDRVDDAAIFFKNPSFSILVRRLFERPADADAQHQLVDWLGKYSTLGDYDQVRLIDAQSVTRLSIPAGLNPARSNTVQAASEALRTGQITLLDFYRDKHDQRVRLAVLIPIFDEADANRPLGVLILRIDPAIHLYPLITQWLRPSLTAETLLVRRDGNEVIFLNELRFQTNTALNLRAPLDRAAMPAVQAALGREGIMDGIDYRGVPVMAVLRTIPDSPWSLVARMDAEEVYAPTRTKLWQVAVMVGGLLLGAGACVGLVWRQQRIRFYRDRAEAVDVLRASELRYRRLFESAKDGILILDAETGMVVDVNPFLVQSLGFSREAFLGKAIWELGFFKDIVANQDSFAELQRQQYIRYEDKPLKAADGRRIDVEFVSNVYLVDRQKVIQCNIRDITERKRAEGALKLFRALVDQSSDAIEVLDPETGRFLDVNERGCLDLGYSREEFLALHVFDIDPMVTQSVFARATEELQKSGVLMWQGIHRRKDGSTFPVEVSIKYVRTDRDYMVTVARDITKHKRAEAEREQMQAQLLQSQKLESIGTLAGGVAHEINNPIMGIMNYAQLIVDQLGPDSPATEYATEIGKETQRVATIVKNLLSFARQDNDIHRSPAGLCDIVEDTLSLIRAVMRHDQITLEVHVPADLPRILCRSQQIRQVIMNLLTNARDALNQKYPGQDENKKVIISAREEVIGEPSSVTASGKRWVRLTVEDHGPGIPEELRERIFNPFFSTKSRHQGTGLGLSISHGIVTDHGGKLSVESEVGQWTRFHMDLPAVPAEVPQAQTLQAGLPIE